MTRLPRLPAHYCPDADLTLRWDEHTLHWVLRQAGVEIARTPGYPTSGPPVTAPAALAWAEDHLGPQEWINRPARSSAWHTHTHSHPCP